MGNQGTTAINGMLATAGVTILYCIASSLICLQLGRIAECLEYTSHGELFLKLGKSFLLNNALP
jgi:hypothetical protein